MTNNKFNFFIPLQSDSLSKAQEKDGKEIYYFEGLASDATQDADDESLDPEGFDLSEFKFINWNHSSQPEDQIGVPVESKVIPGKGFYVRGALFSNIAKGKATIELMKALDKAERETGKQTNLGISVEGQVIERDPFNPQKVKRAKITAIAICPFPKNPNTWASLVRKGFNGTELDTETISANPSTIVATIVGNEYVSIDSNLTLQKSKLSDMLKSSIEIVKKGHEIGLVSDDVLIDLKNKFEK